mmetsp:Transcript_52296/g.151986  ORF Transcript_52296/g.151986 Transcript_52296/m.151986 type:complete len:310 (+) Transcript_52296:210-1139(+)
MLFLLFCKLLPGRLQLPMQLCLFRLKSLLLRGLGSGHFVGNALLDLASLCIQVEPFHAAVASAGRYQDLLCDSRRARLCAHAQRLKDVIGAGIEDPRRDDIRQQLVIIDFPQAAHEPNEGCRMKRMQTGPRAEISHTFPASFMDTNAESLAESLAQTNCARDARLLRVSSSASLEQWRAVLNLHNVRNFRIAALLPLAAIASTSAASSKFLRIESELALPGDSVEYAGDKFMPTSVKHLLPQHPAKCSEENPFVYVLRRHCLAERRQVGQLGDRQGRCVRGSGELCSPLQQGLQQSLFVQMALNTSWQC